MGIDLKIIKGTSRDFALTAMTPEGLEITENLTAADDPTATVWPGGDRPATFTPTAAWTNAGEGLFTISLVDADTADVDPAIYYLQAWAVVSGRTLSLLPEGTTLEVLASPGAVAKRPSYVTLNDVKAIAPWINGLQAPDSNAGFDVQLSEARDWLDECILRNYKGAGTGTLGAHGVALDAWFTGSGQSSLPDRWLKDQLAANKLIVTSRIKRICALYAIHLICESMISPGGSRHLALGARCRYEAENLLTSTVAEIDTDGDGYGDVPINFSSANTLWA